MYVYDAYDYVTAKLPQRCLAVDVLCEDVV